MARLKCTKCGVEGHHSKFRKDKRLRRGYRKLCRQCCIDYCATWRKHNKYVPTLKDKRRAYRDYHRIRNVIFDYYGWRCKWCHEDDRLALTLDHCLNNGNKHRRKVGKTTLTIYRDVIKQGFPKTFQTLCTNCNIVKHKLGGQMPPHRKNKYK